MNVTKDSYLWNRKELRNRNSQYKAKLKAS